MTLPLPLRLTSCPSRCEQSIFPIEMRILITSGIFPPDIGGPATYVPRIAKGLAERGHQITVVTLSDRLDHDDSSYLYNLIRLPRRGFRPWRWIRTVFTIIRLGRNAEVLFANGLALEAVLANLLLQKQMVQKVVGDLAWERATSKGWTSDDFETFQTTRYWPPTPNHEPLTSDHRPPSTSYALTIEALKSVRSWWTRHADKVIVPSRYLALWVKGWGVPVERIEVIYNAVEPANGISPAVVPLQTHLKIVAVGRLVRWKRVDQVIEAIARIDQAGLIIVGDGPERERLQTIAFALGVADRVYFAGVRSKEETLTLMAACDVFVLNSTYEGFPHVVLEAMSLGLPVVATAVGGTPEVLEEGINGRLINCLNSGALHDDLTKILASSSMRQQLASGALHTAEEFNFKRMVDETEALVSAAAFRDR